MSLPVIVVTIFFAVVALFGFFIAGRNSKDRGLVQTMWVTTALCLWLFWLCAYLSQINPLVAPSLKAKDVCVNDGADVIC
ncbi:hypothetical protein PTSG_05938 [Salpingoeca rosetta]|uniref:V-type proton ATPase subunit e n=1 Tax=Salpingoeca rosetta (strain ATCC 50818 / BSB-021) TaxID=946362 RepID=F2UD78_SALR5|nr:uncharacterized protein PTSG_05938 [Salpingoeca rosetta]EGD74573.1 hypothetical protein PTSG_05938 [Salpingoeca rosetta]|eukprot:XP_004992830.1 hypothetical protein PTSG_05938 [Salpingoeca rosetta]